MCLVLALILFSQDDCIFIPSAITGRNIYHTGPAILNHTEPRASKKYQIQILRALTPSRLIPFWSNSKIDLFLAPSGYQECPSALHILIFEYWCRWAVSVSMHVIPEVNFPKKANYNFSPDSESPPRLPPTDCSTASWPLSLNTSSLQSLQQLLWRPPDSVLSSKKEGKWISTILKRKQKY